MFLTKIGEELQSLKKLQGNTSGILEDIFRIVYNPGYHNETKSYFKILKDHDNHISWCLYRKQN